MTYVDERIVELRFDNKQFEQETAKSMSTLDKLKEKLSFKGASTGAEQLQKAVANINVNPVIQGIDAIETKMSALGIAGKRIIENLVDWGMTGVHKIVNAFEAPINQIVQGGKTRAQNIEQAKFQLEGLGVAWSEIEADISYGVQDTAYGLDAAAKVASQLVASQVRLGDEMKHALLGISGVAAMTNSSYEDIGRVYTTVAGNGRLMGEQLLQLSSRGINAAATLGKALNKTEADIRDMVSKGQISFQMFSDAMFEAFGEHAKSANKTFQGALSNTKAALSRLGADVAAQGFNSIRDILNEIIPKLKELKKALKPVEEAIISMVDAIGKLVQSFIKSIDIQGIVDRIAPKIEKFANLIGDVATAWKELHEHEEKMNAITFTNYGDYYQQRAEAMRDSTDELKESVNELLNITPEQKKMAEDIWNFGTYGNGEDRVNALGKDYGTVQAYVNKMIELGWDEAKMEEYLADERKKAEEAEKRSKRAEKLKNTVSKVRTILTNFKRVVSNVYHSITNVLGAAFDGLSESISGKGVLDGIVSLTGKIADLSDKLFINKDRAEKIKPVVKTIADIAKKIGSILVKVAKALWNVIKYSVEFIKKVADNPIVKRIGTAIKNAATSIIDAIEKIYNKLKENGVWDKFVDILKIIVEWLGERLVDAFNLVGDVAKGIGEGAGDVFGKVADKIKSIWENAKEGHPWLKKIADVFKEDILSGSWLEKLKEIVTDVFGDGKDVFKRAFNMASDFVKGIAQGFSDLSLEDVDRIKDIIIGLGLAIASIRWLWSWAKMNNALSTMTGSLTAIFETLNTTIKKYGKQADAKRFESFANSIMKIIGTLIALMISVAVLQGLGFDAYQILDVAAQIVFVITVVVGVVSILQEFFHKTQESSSTYNFFGGLKTPGFALTLFALGYLVSSLITSVMAMYNLMNDKHFDPDILLWVTLSLGGLLVGIGVLAVLAIKFSKAISGIGGIALTLVSVGLLITMLVRSFTKLVDVIGETDSQRDVEQATGIILSLLVPILVFAAGVVAINGALPQKGLITNPFKGMFGMFVALAALIRLAFVPLLKALVAANKEGDEGVDAIGDFEDILGNILTFVGIISVISLLLSRTISAGGFSTSSKTGPIAAVAAFVAALYLLFTGLAKVLDAVDGVSTKQLNRIRDIIKGLEWFIGIMVVLVGVGSAIAGPAVIGGLLSLAAVIASVGFTMLGAGLGFKAFEEGLRAFIDYLPTAVDNILAFFGRIHDNKDALVNGIKETVLFMFEGFNAAITSWLLGLQTFLPQWIDALMLAFIALCNGFADSITKNGKDVVDAADNAAMALLYFAALVVEKFQEKGKDLFKSIIPWIGKQISPHNETLQKGWGEAFGTDTTATLVDPKALEQQTKKAVEEGKKSGEESAKAFYDSQAEAWKNSSAIGPMPYNYSSSSGSSFDVNDFLGYVGIDTNKIPNEIKNIVGGRVQEGMNKVATSKYFNVSEFTEGLSIEEMFSGYTDTSWYSDMLADLQTKSIESGEDLSDIFEQYSADNFNILNMNTDDYTQVGENQFNNVGEGIRSKEQFIMECSKAVSEKAQEELYSQTPKFLDIGNMYGRGVAIGMTDGNVEYNMRKAIETLGGWASGGLMGELEEKSPSRVAMGIGEYFTQGFANGILALGGVAENATEDVGKDATSTLRSILDRLFDTTIENMDTNPTITPVLDLSQLEEGIGSMNGMLDNNSSFGLAFGNAASYNNGLSAKFAGMKVQNEYDGTNVVEAVNSLRTDINEIKAEITTLGFYVDGKQMATAIADPMNSALNKIAVNTGRGVR